MAIAGFVARQTHIVYTLRSHPHIAGPSHRWRHIIESVLLPPVEIATSGIERSSIQPVPLHLKTVRWPDLFLLVSNFLINPSTIVIGGLAVASGLSFWATVITATLGILTAFSAYIIMATVGVDYGITGQVACRMVFGIQGAKWLPSIMRIIASTYWFAVQTIVAANVVVAIRHQVTGANSSVILTGLLLATLQVILALAGYDWLKNLSRYGFPIKIAGIAYMFWLLAHVAQPSYHPSAVFDFQRQTGWRYGLCAVWLNSMVAAWLTMITDAADFCRYTRSRRDMWWGTMLAGLLATAFSVSLGAYGACASLGRETNPFSLTATISPHWFTLTLILLVITLDETTINVMNLYTGGLSLTNFIERPGRFWNTLAVGVVSVALSAFPLLLTRLLPFTTFLGNLFAPVAGVLLFHYLFIARMQIDVPALFDPHGIYRYFYGVNLTAILWCLLGYAVYSALPVAALPAVITPVVTGLGYLITLRTISPRTPGSLALAMPIPRCVIFDTDPSPDDAVAFLAALASPEELEVLAITTVAGNVPLELTTRNALQALELAHRTDIPVYPGASAPLVRPLVTAEHVHGRTGFDGYNLPGPASLPRPGFAPDAIVELVMGQPPGTVTLCCLAPLTNIALAIAREPRLAKHLAGIVLMGGSMSEAGNITPAAEFNFYVDPEAAARVFASGASITMIPLDCTHQALITDARLDRLRCAGTPVGEAFYHLLEFNKRFDRKKYGWPGGPLHDATVAAFLLRPDLFDGRHVHVDIECSSELTLGASVVDWWGVTGKPANATVLRTIDADGYFKLIFDRLLRL